MCVIVLVLLPFRMHICMDRAMHINSCKLHLLFLLVLPAPRLLQLGAPRLEYTANACLWLESEDGSVSGSDGGRVGGVLQGWCRGCYWV